MTFKKIDNQQKLPEMEVEVMNFWREDNTFQKSLELRENAELYSFYDGPPFATGTMHYGHIVGSVMKDCVPRYWTMRGFRVPRRWGWDCHGLPIENIAEKELNIQRKKEIDEMGVNKFNDTCRSKVLEYVAEWEKDVERLGRWADMKNAYRTMDPDYMETIWWVFKQMFEKDLVYKAYRSMHICPRCETTLSQSEVAEGYQTVKDLSLTAKFKLSDEPDTYILAWTTTPWTLIGNVALAVGTGIDYVKVRIVGQEGYFILAKDRLTEVIKDEHEVMEEIEGSDLVGRGYEPLFDDYARQEIENKENGWKIYGANFVTTEEGTGVVHIAPAFGEDDMSLGRDKNLPFVQHVGMDGLIKSEVAKFGGLDVKPKDDPQATDVVIMKDLHERGLLFAKEKYEHSYPHCWRCDTPLLNYATSSWFIAVTKIRDQLLAKAGSINWVPGYIKEGRFGNWLENARDWSISRQRYWASVIPIWECECGEQKVVGSIAELEELSGQKVEDLHKDKIDPIIFPCPKCGKDMRRIPDVLDCWFESGSMPYAQLHYPFENKEELDNGFPAQYIGEGIDQTSKWFYYLHVIATAIKGGHAYENVIVNGIILAEDGKKMSKRLRNYPDPNHIFDKYGADPLRFYLLKSGAVAAENMNFSEKEVEEVSRGLFRMLWNSFTFFNTYAVIDRWEPKEDWRPNNLLDKWMLSELQLLIKEVNEKMGVYELNKAVRPFQKFIDNLSNWYIRRSRRRFWKSESDEDKNDAYQTLFFVLRDLAKLMAPFTPFIAEKIYRNLTGEGDSVHLQDYPQAEENLIDEELGRQMDHVRKAIEMGLHQRSINGIKVRQPLNQVMIESAYFADLDDYFKKLIEEELNVKQVSIKENRSVDAGLLVMLDTNISPELKQEGLAREIVRFIQESRKKAGFEIDDRIEVYYQANQEMDEAINTHMDYISREVLADKIGAAAGQKFDYEVDDQIEGIKIKLQLKKNR